MRRTENMAEVGESLLQGQFQLPLKEDCRQGCPRVTTSVSHLFLSWSFLWWWRRREAVSRWPGAAAGGVEVGGGGNIASWNGHKNAHIPITMKPPAFLPPQPSYGWWSLIVWYTILPPPAHQYLLRFLSSWTHFSDSVSLYFQKRFQSQKFLSA